MAEVIVFVRGLIRSSSSGLCAAGSSFLSANHNPALPWTQRRRHIHCTFALTGKSLLRKFTGKSKKKFWYESTSVGNLVVNKPESLTSLMKVQRKENRGDNIRIKALNVILHRALTDMLHTSEVSQEVCDLNVELSKVSVSVDFSVCRAYWMANGNNDTDSNIEKVLQNYAPCFRHRMLTHQVLGSVPPIVFVRDKEDARIQEVEKLLATAEFGEENENPLSVVDPSASKNLQFSAIASGVPGESMFGIDHADLNKQILEYKRKVKEKMKEADENLLLFKQQEQLAVIRKQKILKRKKQKRFLHDDNDSPQEYLLSRYNNINAVESVSNEIEFDYELQKEIKELKKERPGESKINLSGQS